MENTRVSPLIIQPFVENAILHGLKNNLNNDGIVTINIERKIDGVIYTITDKGIGREAAAKITTSKVPS